jgi:hypothetical protein
MPIGNLGLKGLGRLGGGLGSVVGDQDRPTPPPPPAETGIIQESVAGFILTENNLVISTE